VLVRKAALRTAARAALPNPRQRAGIDVGGPAAQFQEIVGKLWARGGQGAASESVDVPLNEASRTDNTAADQQIQKFQSSSSVLTALPITYDEPEPEKKSWFSSALGDNADRMAGLTSVSSRGNSAS
jgi:hypothetical protein